MNLNLIYYLGYIIAIFNLIQCKRISISNENEVPIFQPFPSQIIKISDICENGSASALKSFIKQEQVFIAIALSNCGVIIYKITDINNPIVVFQNRFNDYKINGITINLSISSDIKYLWVTNSMGFVFTIDLNTNPFKIISAFKVKDSIQVNAVTLMKKDTYILLCSKGFQIYLWEEGKDNWTYQQTVSISAINVLQIQFVRDYSYALVTADVIGVIFYKVTESPNLKFTQSCSLQPYFFNVNQFLLIDDNTIAIILEYKGIYLYDLTEYFKQDGICSKDIFKYLTQTPSQGQGGMMVISSDRKFIYSQFRSIGALIYDVSEKTFNLVQKLQVEFNSKDISLCEVPNSFNLLFYSNSDSLQIFKQTTPNFNRDKPNLLLNEYQQVSYSDFKESSILGNLDYACLYKEEDQTLYISRANYGSAVFQYRGGGIIEYLSFVSRQPSRNPTSMIVFLKDKVRAYIVKVTEGLTLINYSDPSNPQIEKTNITFNQTFVQFSQLILKSDYSYGFISNNINILFLDLKDPLNPEVVKVFDTFQYSKNPSCSNINFSKNEKVLLSICFKFGIIVLDISDVKNPKYRSSLFTDGAYDLKQTNDEKYFVVGTGYKGVLITQLDANQQLQIVSSTSILGAAFQLLIMQNDNYVIVTSNEDASIQLIDIKNKKYPVVIQRFGKQSAFGYYSMCLSKDSSYIFITSQYEFLLLQLENQIILHTQTYELISKENSNEYIRKDLTKNQALKIGQKIEMHLVQIYQDKEIFIKKAFYYQNFILQDLPYWMSYSSSQRILSLTISKDSLQKDSDGNYIDTEQQVVFLAYQFITDQAFINSNLSITDKDSVQIKQFCMLEGLIDKNGFVIDSYSPKRKFSLGPNESVYLSKWVQNNTDVKVKRFIQYTLNQNIINYTTSFIISNSIQVDLNSKESPIFSLQSEITLEMQVVESDPYATQKIHLIKNIDSSHFNLSEKGKFVKRSYSGILMLLSEKQNEIKIEGSLSNVNNVLSQGIKFSVSNHSIDDSVIYIKIIISDGVNYNYENILPYKEIQFIKMQSPVVLSDVKNLNEDFQSRYPEGSIYIQENLQYQVSLKVFTSNDEKQLSYTSQILIDSEYQEIPKDFWLSYSSTDRIFSGTPPPKEFQNSYTIQVNATDGYTYVVDTFVIRVNRIPFSYVMQFAIQILGPIFGIFGFWKYKHLMYNIMFKTHYMYSTEIVYVGEQYKKQIPSSNNTREIAIHLRKFFIENIDQQSLRQQVQTELHKTEQTKSIKIDQFLKEYQKYNKLQFYDAIFFKMFPQGVSNKDLNLFNNKDKDIINRSLKNTQILQFSHDLEQENLQRSKEMTYDQKINILSDQVIDIQGIPEKRGRSKSNLNVFSLNEIGNIGNQQSESQIRNFASNLFINSDRPKGSQSQIFSPYALKCNNVNIDNSNQNQSIAPSDHILQSPQPRKKSNQQQSEEKVAKRIARNINTKRVTQESRSKQRTSYISQKILNQPEVYKQKYKISLFTSEGKINYREITKFLYEKQKEIPEKKRVTNDLELQRLLDPNSILSQAISGLTSEYLLQLSSLSKSIFEQLHCKALQYYKEIDWYKAYLNIDPNFQSINIDPYPNISIHESTFRSALLEICESINSFLVEESQSSPGSAKNRGGHDTTRHTSFSIELIEQALKSKALGFSMNSLQILQKTCGETLHSYSHSIHSIKAFELNKEMKYCLNIRKCLDLDYIQKGLTDNDPLPSWIQAVDLIHGVILLCGVPEKKDVGSIFLKVFDDDMFIIRSYEIKVIEKTFQNNNGNQHNLDYIQTNNENMQNISEVSNNNIIPNQNDNQQESLQIENNKIKQYSETNMKQKQIQESTKKKQITLDQKSPEISFKNINQEVFNLQHSQNSYKYAENESPLIQTPSTIQINQALSPQEKQYNINSSPPTLKLDSSHSNISNESKQNIYYTKDHIKGESQTSLVQINQNLIYSQDLQKSKQFRLSSAQISDPTIYSKLGQLSGTPQFNNQQFFKDASILQQIENNQQNKQQISSHLLEYSISNAIYPQSLDNFMNRQSSKQFESIAKNHAQDNSLINLDKEQREASVSINITEKFQHNIQKQEMKSGDSFELNISGQL